MKTTTLADAFAFFGTRPGNPRWSWSGASPDSKTIAVTLWEHEVGVDGSIDYFDDPGSATWTSKPGNQERIRNLLSARDNCDALFHVIRITACDPDENTLTIAGRYPEEHFMMKLIDVDEVTGAFSAVLVDPLSAGHERRMMSDRPTKPPVCTPRARTGGRRTANGPGDGRTCGRHLSHLLHGASRNRHLRHLRIGRPRCIRCPCGRMI